LILSVVTKGLSGLEVGDDVEQFLDDNAIRQVVKRPVQILQQLVDTFLSALHRSQATGFSLARDSAHALKIEMKSYSRTIASSIRSPPFTTLGKFTVGQPMVVRSRTPTSEGTIALRA
jgi:hypothetical protein